MFRNIICCRWLDKNEKISYRNVLQSRIPSVRRNQRLCQSVFERKEFQYNYNRRDCQSQTANITFHSVICMQHCGHRP